jgi:NitT/TauT family transport system permease protein
MSVDTPQVPATAAAPELPPARSLRKGIWANRFVPPLLFVALFLTGWVAAVSTVETALLPNPAEVAVFIWDELRADTIAKHNVYQTFGISLVRLAAGLSIALVLGSVIGLLMGRSRRITAFLADFVIADLNMPYLLWALLWSLWLGFSFWTPVFTIVLASVPFVITNVAEGVRNVPRELVDMAKSYGVDRRTVVRHLIVPSLMPFLFAGFRYALSLGWKAVVIAELFGSDRGVGWMLKFWYDAHRITALVGYTFFFVVLAVLIDRFFLVWLGRRVFRWRGEHATLMS